MTLTNEQFNKTTSEWPDWPSSRHVTSISKQPNIPTIQQSISTFSSRSAEKKGARRSPLRRQWTCRCAPAPRCCVSWPGENLQPDGIHHRHRPRPTVQPFGIQHNCLLLGCPYTDGATVSDVHFNQRVRWSTHVRPLHLFLEILLQLLSLKNFKFIVQVLSI